jgi:hypothetical protein
VRVAVGMAVAALVIALTGCSTGMAPTPTPTRTATTHAPGSMIGGIIEPSGTTWSGTDSAGDLSVFVLQRDHTVKVTYGTNTFDEPGDTWDVTTGALSLHVYIDAADGYLDYTGKFDVATGAITATATTTVSAKTITVTLARK